MSEDKADLELKLFANSIKFLEKTSNEIEFSPSYLSHLELKRTIYALRSRSLIRSKPGIRCDKCLMYHAAGPSSFRTQSNLKYANSRFARRMKRKMQSGKAKTSFQSRYIHMQFLKPSRQLVVVCGFCKKQKKIPIPSVAASNNQNKKNKKEVVNITRKHKSDNLEVKKKKKKKDKYCGLNEEIVNLVSSNKEKKKVPNKNQVILQENSSKRNRKKQESHIEKLAQLLGSSKNTAASSGFNSCEVLMQKVSID